ncbi:MAG TPA: RhuM family protein [Chlamydiales bacterium]|nr:MAG: hypothetical protein A3F67_03090 [Verrucomicrobia bacterium RIFCSPHIGHO2_12_FULL_41_10]HLB52428.1 RhuM family protein [Chlamydiales bacterium]
MSEPQANDSQILLYQTEDGRQRIEVRLQNGSVWLSQKLLAELFGVGVNTVNYHIKEIYKEEELRPEATIRKYRIVQTEGERQVFREVDFYDLRMILAVGYRVRSHRGVQFRQWATERLQEYVIKGFTLDDERLSKPEGIDYFDELLDRIRAIRSSEKRFYQKIKDIYTLSADLNLTMKKFLLMLGQFLLKWPRNLLFLNIQNSKSIAEMKRQFIRKKSSARHFKN